MLKARIRIALAVSILLLTIFVFIHFFTEHPEYWRSLKTLSPWTIVWVLLLNGVMVGLLVGVNACCLALCGKRIGLKENFLLTSYSSIANFFGPLQSGPGVRAVYLKAKHKVRIRDFTLATLLSLGAFASFSALFLLIGIRPWWQTILTIAAVAGFSFFVVRFFMRRDKHPDESQFALRPKIVGILVGLAFLQVLVTVGWYYVEIHAVDPSVNFGQAMSYAGAANFSLFVSITPDAIGIREAFLVFSQNIHHVSTATILKANLIDRAAYVLFLALLFVVVLAMHAKDTLQITKLRRSAAAESSR